jgi:hypothetical protein
MGKNYAFLGTYTNLKEILMDHELASLGDAFINFAYSLALSNKSGKPSGTKLKGSLLAEATRKAGLREVLPSRMSSHNIADAAEALIVYAWLTGKMSLDETVATLTKADDTTEALIILLSMIRKRVRIS